jgi:hypothetical protein
MEIVTEQPQVPATGIYGCPGMDTLKSLQWGDPVKFGLNARLLIA